ncbi:MAG: penicillin-binding protein 2 [Nocardioides sp.]
MNKPIRTMALFCLTLFLALLLNATYLQYVQAGELNQRSENRRVVQAAFSRERGAILVGRTPVAESVPSQDKYAFQRTYPEPFKYAHLTGVFSFYNQTGIERAQNEVLSGADSRLFVNRLVDLLKNDAPKGGHVELTLNPDAQDAAVEGLRALGDGVQGAVVAIEPSTGKVLAMASSPSFDPNKLASHDLDSALNDAKALAADESQPLLNRAIQTTLPPGSTFKLVTAAAAIESGKYDANSMVPGGSSFDLPQSDKTIGNHDGGNCGGDKISLTQALAVSCNVTFLSLADELGQDKLREMAEKFGFNSVPMEDLPLVAPSRFPTSMDRPQTAMSGIGQFDVAATPLQMAMVAAAIANGGQLMRPYVVESVQSPTYSVLDQTQEEVLSTPISSGTARELTDMMVATVNTGTAGAARIDGVEVAGKTGTAQAGEGRPPYAWFVSFAPADDPQVAVAVMVESSDTDPDEIAGGRLGAPIAKAVMEAVIRP